MPLPGLRAGCVLDDPAHVLIIAGLELPGVVAGPGQGAAELAQAGDGLVDVTDALVKQGSDVAAGGGAPAAQVEDAADLAEGQAEGFGLPDELGQVGGRARQCA